MMPIYFNVKEVREYLQRTKMVFTLRKPRSVGVTDAVVGSYLKHMAFATVEIIQMVENVCRPEQLELYVSQSGLLKEGESIEEATKRWFTLAQKMSGFTLNLYQVIIEKDLSEPNKEES